MEKLKKIWFNGYEYETKQKLTIEKLIYYFKYENLFVLEYNSMICNKKIWNTVLIENGDKIEIITLVGGG